VRGSHFIWESGHREAGPFLAVRIESIDWQRSSSADNYTVAEIEAALPELSARLLPD
jgi:hypothetical protein